MAYNDLNSVLIEGHVTAPALCETADDGTQTVTIALMARRDTLDSATDVWTPDVLEVPIIATGSRLCELWANAAPGWHLRAVGRLAERSVQWGTLSTRALCIIAEHIERRRELDA